jgi:hypothetical protein
MEYRPAGETEVLRENQPHYHDVHHKYHMTWTWTEPVSLSFEDNKSLPELWHGWVFLKKQVINHPPKY